MNAICPSRIISESIRILSLLHADDAGEAEQISANVHDLQELRARLDRTGMTYIHADGTNNARQADNPACRDGVTQMTNRIPTVAEAIDYARRILPEGAIIFGSTAPGFDLHNGERIHLPGTRNVPFIIETEFESTYRGNLTVWFEGGLDCAPFIYGEW